VNTVPIGVAVMAKVSVRNLLMIALLFFAARKFCVAKKHIEKI
jgi:hypothetical protein